MLAQFGLSTWVAILVGGLVAVVAFVPVAAYRYRKTGRLRLLDVAVLLAVAVYAVALWSYTLIPLPKGAHYTCVGVQLKPLQFLSDIATDGRSLVHNRAFLQAMFNVILFLPLGFFVRILLRRGLAIATACGALFSALIETTQLTGVWGLFPCAYRIFDVDDLLLNTTGALLGSVIALPLARVLVGRAKVVEPARLTLGRRLVGMLGDLFTISLIGFSLTVAWRGIALFWLELSLDELPSWADAVLGTWPVFLLEGYWILARGRSIGEAFVGLVPIARPGKELGSRVVKFFAGVGGYLILAVLPGLFTLLLPVFVLATVVTACFSRRYRGLSHALAGMELQVEGPSSPPPSILFGWGHLRREAEPQSP